MREAFKASGINATLDCVSNGEDAIAYLAQRGDYQKLSRPNLLLLDLNLPRKSGIEVLKEIRGNKDYDDLSIFILTGSNASTDIKACAQFSGCRYLIKPTRFHELVDLVKSLEPI